MPAMVHFSFYQPYLILKAEMWR